VSLVKADGQIPTVMAASILAKTYRDELMKVMHLAHPQYKWDHNVGYGAADHLSAIEKYGPCPLHRFSYAPMKNMK
jgi:ribonuclease HII